MRLALFLIFPFILFSQESKLSGIFCNPVPVMDIGQCFTFSKDQKFTWDKGSHTPPDITGSGTYEIIENKLILNYQKVKAYNSSFHKHSKRISVDETIRINFIVKNLNDDPLSNVQVAILNNRGYLLDRLVLNEKGEGKLIFDSSSNELIRLEVSRVGYESLILESRKNNNYIISAFLSNLDQKLPLEPHRDTLLIKKITSKKLVLEDSKGSVMEYSKINF